MKPSTFQCRFSHAARVAPLDVQGAVACVIALLEGGADPTERDFLVRSGCNSCILHSHTHVTKVSVRVYVHARGEEEGEGGREGERERGRERE